MRLFMLNRNLLAVPAIDPHRIASRRAVPAMTRAILAASALVGLHAADSAAGLIPDNLRCYKIKDDLAKAAYTATITPFDVAFAASPGCQISVPPKLLCVQAGTSEITPPPPGAPSGPFPSQYLCYKTKCPDTAATFIGSDEFGTHGIRISKTSLACFPIVPVCGDGLLEGPEQCDDGNVADGDGCSGTCAIETVCGDGILGGSEGCDDGNLEDGDGCSATCHLEPVCGNHFTEPGEECDDGNLKDGDGCSHDCLVEQP